MTLVLIATETATDLIGIADMMIITTIVIVITIPITVTTITITGIMAIVGGHPITCYGI